MASSGGVDDNESSRYSWTLTPQEKAATGGSIGNTREVDNPLYDEAKDPLATAQKLRTSPGPCLGKLLFVYLVPGSSRILGPRTIPLVFTDVCNMLFWCS